MAPADLVEALHSADLGRTLPKPGRRPLLRAAPGFRSPRLRNDKDFNHATPPVENRCPTALIVLGSLTLAACGDDTDSGSMPGMNHGAPSASSSSTSTAPAGDFNDADVTFATQMIPHHQQAVQMANMAGYNATTPDVKNLATAIKAAQDPEIKTPSVPGACRPWP
ncbi:DUF305 domain-containing protein [Kribbella sp. DT2]|uniref:DUF305 domain-containing protein n=1 Tax=Kribbella sp. DT2 TaxID=3393427 RepID=UPI003CF7AADB